MEIRFDTSGYAKLLDELSPKKMRVITRAALRAGAQVITRVARSNLAKVLRARKGNKERVKGIITTSSKRGDFAASRISALRRKTGKWALDNAYLLRILEQGAAKGGTADRFTRGKAGEGKYAEAYRGKILNRGRIAPTPFFAPAREQNEAKALETVRTRIYQRLDKL